MEQPSAQAQLSTTLVSMSLILLTMFLYLNSIAKFDPKKRDKVITSISQVFSPQLNHISLEEKHRRELLHAMSDKLKQVLVPIRGAQFSEAPGDSLLVTLESDLVFIRGDSQLNADGIDALHRFAETIKSWPVSVEIEAHTDNTMPEGNRYQSQWALTMAQASAMYRLLVSYGLADDNVSAAGLADSRPVASNDSTAGQAKNRRVVVRLRPLSEDEPPAIGGGGSNAL